MAKKTTPEEERANRRQLLPEGLSLRDKLWYGITLGLGYIQKQIHLYCIQEPVWRAQSGRVQLMRDLEARHLFNIAAMLDRDGAEVDPITRTQVYQEVKRRRTLGIYLEDQPFYRRKKARRWQREKNYRRGESENDQT